MGTVVLGQRKMDFKSDADGDASSPDLAEPERTRENEGTAYNTRTTEMTGLHARASQVRPRQVVSVRLSVVVA